MNAAPPVGRRRKGRRVVKRFPLQAGTAYRDALRIELLVDGTNSYVRIEDRAGNCWATLGGPIRLRKLANAILNALTSDQRPWEGL